jgi:hypothetical protein
LRGARTAAPPLFARERRVEQKVVVIVAGATANGVRVVIVVGTTAARVCVAVVVTRPGPLRDAHL